MGQEQEAVSTPDKAPDGRSQAPAVPAEDGADEARPRREVVR